MFDFAWTEIGLIGVVAMILIGPKDLPVAIKAVTDVIKKARRMAGEFQGHVDEMLRDSSLSEVRDSLNEIRNMDIRGEITRAIDEDGSLRAAFNDDPFAASSVSSAAVESVPIEEPVILAPAPEPARVEAPAFIPPEMIPPPPVDAPAFIPPECAHPEFHRAGR